MVAVQPPRVYPRVMFDTWAEPVTSKPWATVAAVAHRVMRATGYRVGTHIAGFAWERSHGDRTRQHPWQSAP